MNEDCGTCHGWPDACSLYDLRVEVGDVITCNGKKSRLTEDGWEFVDPQPLPLRRQVIATAGFIKSFSKLTTSNERQTRQRLRRNGIQIEGEPNLTVVEETS